MVTEKELLCRGMNEYKTELLKVLFDKHLLTAEISEEMLNVSLEYINKVFGKE